MGWAVMACQAHGQTIECQSKASGYIAYHHTRALDSIIALQRERNRYDRTIHGYRLQLAAVSSRSEAIALKKEIHQEFDSLAYYIDYHSPYYKLKVGNFRTRTNALLPRLMLQEAGYDGFIVPDKIDFPALPGDRKQ